MNDERLRNRVAQAIEQAAVGRGGLMRLSVRYALADAAIAAYEQPTPDPYAELIDELAAAAWQAHFQASSPGSFPEGASHPDNWRNIAEAVLEKLREGASERSQRHGYTGSPEMVDAVIPKRPSE